MKQTIFEEIKKKFLIVAIFMYFFVSFAIFIFQAFGYIDFILRNLTMQAKLIGDNCAVAILFNDKNSAQDMLKKFSELEDIEMAAIITKDREIFSKCSKNANINFTLPEKLDSYFYRFHLTYLIMLQPIHFNDEFMGSIYVIGNLRYFYERLLFKLFVILIIFMVTIWLGYRYFASLSSKILKPITNLANTMEKMSTNKDYSIRIECERNDEFNILCKHFNVMAELIENHTKNLEMEVAERLKELKNTQAQLIHSSKLASLGEMATGIAHEINQPLSIIKFICQSIFFKSDEGLISRLDSNLQSDLLKIEMQVERIKRIIDHLRTFARKGESNLFEKFDLKSILEDTFMFVGQQLKNMGIKLEIHFPFEPLWVKADRMQIEQVFLNLITNARDAMEHIEREKILSISASINDENFIEIRFTDTGSGIPGNIRDKIFEPFFTTKEVGKGTGLGLSISYGIVKDVGGDILVESVENIGTTFIVKLPLAKE